MKRLIIVIVLWAILTALVPVCANKTVFDERDVDTAIAAVVDSEHVSIIRAMVWVESKGDTTAVSNTGDYGILQVNKAVWGSIYDFSRMNELYYGLSCGYSIFKHCLDIANGNVTMALKLYNGSDRYAKVVYKAMGDSIVFSKSIR